MHIQLQSPTRYIFLALYALSALLVATLSHAVLATSGAELPVGKSRFVFSDWAGPDLPIWVYIPAGGDRSAMPIVIVMHGTKRDADRYRDEWAPVADKHQLIVIAPEFSKKDFPKSAGYNLGNIYAAGSQTRNPEALWSFSAIEPLFNTAVKALDSSQKAYTLYGHSAGSQFVHRFLYFKPDARVSRYLPANAGWYTLPNFKEEFPYGLRKAALDKEALKRALQKDVLVLLGDRDTDQKDRNLRRTQEAMRQGKHRFERGLTFFKMADQQAQTLGVPLEWRVSVVHGARHSNAQMAQAAGALVKRDDN